MLEGSHIIQYDSFVVHVICVLVIPCLLSHLVVENDSVRAAAVRALHAALKLHTSDADCVTCLLSRVTRGKSQAGIIADSSYAAHVSVVTGHIFCCYVSYSCKKMMVTIVQIFL